jgi:4'-phosphopantetheinyl transferase
MIHTNLALASVRSYRLFARNANIRRSENTPYESQHCATTAEMNLTVDWSSPQGTPALERNEIHIWRAALSVDQTLLGRLQSTLADDEKTRAARFIFERDRDRFIAARGILRDLLGSYLHCRPQDIKFAYGPRGKPVVANRNRPIAVRFNLSHSQGLAAIAIARHREVGIDIELLRPDFAGEEIAKRYFSVHEIDELNRLPEESRTEGFFLCWTRKEAYIKARGDGLHVPLDSFSVSLSPERLPTLSSPDESRWSIESFVPSLDSEPRYAAAVVAERRDWTARYFEWKKLDGAALVQE